MPTGTGAVALRNLPNVPYKVSPSAFFTLTQRNEFEPVTLPIGAFGNFVLQTLLQVGVIPKLQLITSGSVVSTSTTGTSAKFRWPYGLFGNVQLSGNGQNNFQNVDSYAYQLRTLIHDKAFVDGVTSAPLTPIASGAGTAPFVILHEIPIAIDYTSIVGSLYAQSEATELTLRLQTQNPGLLFTQATIADLTISGNCNIHELFFEVPYDPTSGNRVLVVPDLTVLHGWIGQQNAIGAQSQGTTNLPRQNGQLERLIFWTDDTISSVANSLTPTANYSYIRLTYGSQVSPYDYEEPNQLRTINNQDYRNALPDGVFVMDFIKENPQRDVVLLQGVTNLRLVTGYGTTPTASAFVYYVMETLFA